MSRTGVREWLCYIFIRICDKTPNGQSGIKCEWSRFCVKVLLVNGYDKLSAQEVDLKEEEMKNSFDSGVY